MTRPIILTMLCLLGLHCQPVKQPTQTTKAKPSTIEEYWSKRYWFDKAKRALLLGPSKISEAEEERLLSLPRDQIVDELVKRPEFFNAALDFNMYFMGRRIENLVGGEGLVRAATDSAAAVNAAVELSRDGDYFTFFQWSQTYSSLQDGSYAFMVRDGVPASAKSPDAVRAFWIAEAAKDLARIHETARQADGTAKACALLADPNRPDLYSNLLVNAGLPENLIRLLSLNFKVLGICGQLGIAFPLTSRFRSLLLRELATAEENLKRLPAWLADLPKGRARSVRDLHTLDYSRLAPGTSVLEKAFDERLWNELPNFSTNMNRRRGAYMLKTYFCDDLTPLNIVAPSEHSSDEHASEASCAACHYKLDPMAGFFRSRGIAGTDFQDDLDFNFLVHDDFLTREGEDLKNYQAEWANPEGTTRPWKVGYIRSATKENLNAYGETMDDLFAIIRKSRESKVCLARRMAEYVIGSQQVFDGGWIDSLAEEFHKAAAQTASPSASSLAFKKVYKTLVLSNAFANSEAEAGQCYDFKPGTKPSSLPCAVASIVQKNCAACHAGDDAPGGLDFSTYSEGRFPHKDGDGSELSRAESFRRIADRISSSDPDIQMPLMKQMDAVERANLFKWISLEMAISGEQK